ncbi:MAG: RNA polymerase sigma factor [Myxococcales bacterium]|nr:RNA polymerase sigma factor [Myxococcales bacterium]MCB9700402.1 RNA polymerase sigma factor [Myxococcales bacterium]
MTGGRIDNEREVVRRAAAGDVRAFETIYRTYAPVLFSYVLVPMLGDRDDAQDCLRDTFLSAHKHIANFQWQESGIYPWLKTMAKNKARDLLRASGRRQRLRGAFAEHSDHVTEEAKNPAEEALQRQALRQRIDAILETLNPRYATVLRLRLLEDRSREECAELLEVKVGTLDVLLFRACKSFRAACEKQGLAVSLGGAA